VLPFAATPPQGASTLLINDCAAFFRFSLKFDGVLIYEILAVWSADGGPHWS
jgi:hypothetical protein